eukprot:14772509-Alexandrium_andersonii.AAC.1
MCLSATLAPVIRRIAHESGPCVRQMNLLDDRTLAGATWDDVQVGHLRERGWHPGQPCEDPGLGQDQGGAR